MNRRRPIGIFAATALGMSFFTGSATGQENLLKDQLLGTWTLVSHEAVSMYGTNPQGVAFFDAGGRFIITVMRTDRAKYGTGHPAKGTDEENKATAQGTMTYFGTYTVNEADRTIAIHIDASCFPNWSGADQQRTFSIVGDRLTLTARALGGSADVVWQRAK
jgi:hypothetical protein